MKPVEGLRVWRISVKLMVVDGSEKRGINPGLSFLFCGRLNWLFLPLQTVQFWDFRTLTQFYAVFQICPPCIAPEMAQECLTKCKPVCWSCPCGGYCWWGTAVWSRISVSRSREQDRRLIDFWPTPFEGFLRQSRTGLLRRLPVVCLQFALTVTEISEGFIFSPSARQSSR